MSQADEPPRVTTSTHIIVQNGLDMSGTSLRDATRTESVIQVHDVHPDRDEEVGINMSKFNLNYVFQPPDMRDIKYKSLLGAEVDPESLPKSVDLREEWGEVLNQGSLGSCVANSVAGCIRFARKKMGMTVYNPSRLHIYYYGRKIEDFPLDEDTGLYIRSGYKSVAKYSVCSEKNWPYKEDMFAQEPSEYARAAARQHRAFDYLSLDAEPVVLKKCLADGFPISFGFTVFESFMSASTARTGVVTMPDRRERSLGGHAMSIVGYDDDKQHYIVANSWSSDWGDKGFCYFPYGYLDDDALCGDYWTARRFSK
jgi:C1A family cysteine protease